MTTPSGVDIAGVRYRLAELAGRYREWVESDLRLDSEIAGASRPATEPRADIRTWRIDDWQGGEGQKFIDSDDRSSFTRYLQTDNAVNVGTKGQVSLGYAMADDVPGFSGSMTHGPFLAVTNGYLAAIGTDTSGAGAQRGRRKNLSTGTWSDLATGAAATGQVTGQFRALNNYVFPGFRGGATEIRRIDVSANTNVTFSTFASENPLPADNRMYAARENSGTLQLHRTALTGPPLTPSVVYTADGIGQQGGVTNVGKDIYVVTGTANENAKLHKYDGVTGIEFAQLPDGFRIDPSPYSAAQALSTIVFVGGYREGVTGEPDTPMLVYATSEAIGTAGFIREGTSGRITCLATAPNNKILCGLNTGEIFAYDISTSGISQLFSGISATDRVISIAYAQGRFYAATRTADTATAGTGKVYSTLATGTGKYPASTTITSSMWDGDLPDTEKLLTEVEVQTETLASGTSIEISLLLDGTTTVTTDAAGATMSHASGTRTVFTISDADTERTFRFIRPSIILKTSNTANTPILYSVTLRFRPIPSKLRFFEALIDCQDQSATDRRTGQQLTGRMIRANLETLRDSTTDRVFNFVPLYKDSDSPHPHPTETTHVVMLAPGSENGVFDANEQGEGYMRMRFLKLG